MGTFDPDKLIGDVGPPKHEPPKATGSGLIPLPELKRLAEIHGKYVPEGMRPFRKLGLALKWMEFYSQYDHTKWMTQELHDAAMIWSNTRGSFWGPGTLEMWLESEYKGWAKKQKNRVLNDKYRTSDAEAAQIEKDAFEAAQKVQQALVDEFHELPDWQQKEYRDSTREILVARFPKLPPDWVVEVNAAKLWKKRKESP